MINHNNSFRDFCSGIKDASHKFRAPFYIKIMYSVFFLYLILYSTFLLYSLYRIDYSLLPCSAFYRLCAFVIPIILWLFSTAFDFFNFHYIKTLTYAATAYSEALILITIVFELLSRLLLPGIMSIKTDAIFTKQMVPFLARITTELPLLPFMLLLVKGFTKPILSPQSRKALLSFKITHLPEKKSADNEFEYSLSIAKDIKTGRSITVSEKDRFLHTLVDGTSGTGKTSSTILPAIKDDLDMRCRAEQAQMSRMLELARENKFIYAGDGLNFSLYDFTPADLSESGDAKETYRILDTLRLEYPVCGITVLAPEDSLTDDVCKLCEARGIPYNRIDATLDENGMRKNRWTGMNPFFLSDKLSGDERHQAIVKKAVVFSDVMQVITDLKGKADSYFTGLNRQMLANLAILVMNTVPLLQNRQATPEDLQLLINNFDLLPPYVSKLEQLDREHHRYTFILQYIREDLLGKGRTKMEDQSRGTRNIINEFLLMPGSKEVYCAQTSIDFDRILLNGEITVCNYDLASGDSNAVAFGLFFLLSFNNAVLSRPGTEATRTPHFFYIDELPVLIHSSLEKNFSLFRKFRVAMFCAIQTLDQFEKNDITKYLKGVILGCAHILIFGRSSLSDMEVFSAMAGIHDEIDEQSTVSETALSADSPTLSYSSRETMTQKNIVEEIDIRMRDFQEITFFTTQNGRPLPPYHAKVDFLKPYDWKPAAASDFTAKIFLPFAEKINTSAEEIPPCTHFTGDIISHYQQTPALIPARDQGSRADATISSDVSEPKTAAPADTQPSKGTLPDGSETLDGLF